MVATRLARSANEATILAPSYLLDLRNVLRMPPTSNTSIYMHCTIHKVGFKRYRKKERKLIRQSAEPRFESLALLIRVEKKKKKRQGENGND